MKPAYLMYDGERHIVGLAYTVGENPVILTSIFVSPEERGKGHGRALLKAVCTDADREHKNVMLSVDPNPGIDRDRLVKLCLSFGFEHLIDDATTMLRKWRKLAAIPAQRRTIPSHRHI